MFSSHFLKKPRPKAKFGDGASGEPIGTEAMVAQALERNSKIFNYPIQGFLSRVEHTLMYAMLTEPGIFPPSAVIEQIQSEDFEKFFPRFVWSPPCPIVTRRPKSL